MPRNSAMINRTFSGVLPAFGGRVGNTAMSEMRDGLMFSLSISTNWRGVMSLSISSWYTAVLNVLPLALLSRSAHFIWLIVFLCTCGLVSCTKCGSAFLSKCNANLSNSFAIADAIGAVITMPPSLGLRTNLARSTRAVLL